MTEQHRRAMMTPEEVKEMQERVKKQPHDQQKLFHSLIQKAEHHGMMEPGTSEKFKPQPPEGQAKWRRLPAEIDELTIEHVVKETPALPHETGRPGRI